MLGFDPLLPGASVMRLELVSSLGPFPPEPDEAVKDLILPVGTLIGTVGDLWKSFLVKSD
jgi:hypothetical protein